MDLPALVKGSNLTRTQLLLWAGYRRYEGLPVDTIPFTFELDGELDRDAFQRAFELLVEHHEALRSVFVEEDGVPRRRLLERLDDPLEIVDLAASTDPSRELNAWLRSRNREPLDLARRAFRSALVRLAEDRHVWYLCQHHLVTDGWSMGLVYRRMAALYSRPDQASGEIRAASPSLADFHAERSADIGDERLRRDEAWWADKLARQPETVGLYGDDPGERSPRERRISRRLDATTTAALEELATRPDLRSLRPEQTLSSVFTALVVACLHRISGRSRLAVAVPLHGRGSRGARHLVGLVQETFPLHFEIDDGETFASLIRKSMRETWQALRHGRCGTPVGAGGFDVIVNYLPLRFPDFAGLPTRARWLHNGYGNGRRALFVHVHDLEGSGRLRVDLDANEAACDAERQSRFADHLLNLVDQLVADPDRRLETVELMSSAERREVVAGFNRTRTELPTGLTVSAWLDERMGRFAETEAVVFGERSLTYAELDRRAERFAARLRAHGVRDGAPVAVLADRSIELMIALLAILRAGGAYLPLDPSYPADRLAFMLEDSGARVLLTAEPDSAESLVAGELAGRLVELDLGELAGAADGDGAGADRSGAERLPPPEPADAAYVIYTSGSTGRPKGVAMSQRALANLTWWQIHEGTRLERPRTFQFTPLSFDVSLQETFSTWCSGGTLVLIPEAIRRDPVETLRLLERHRVQRLFAIYTPLRRLAEAACREGIFPSDLREVTAVGEQLQITPALRQLFDRLPDCALYNQYGPSETHNVTAHLLPAETEEWPLLPTIGRPIANTQVYILDRELRPVPVGVAGEIHLGGAQVALGYIGRPALTAERFVPDPFGSDPGGRLYRTGDLGRFASSGEIEFLGRLDHQVKVRGYRIEPGEVESALRRHTKVREAVVVARAEPDEDLRLVGYVVPEGEVEEAKLAAELRAWLGDSLPEYMVPTAFVVLDRLPQTPNGKLDRGALPAPSGVRPDVAASFAAPSGDREARIAAIWCEVLRLESVGRHDNFFDLGGNSLLLLEVHARLPRGGSSELRVADLFRLPTVAELVAHLEGDEGWSASDAVSRAARQKEALARRRPKS